MNKTLTQDSMVSPYDKTTGKIFVGGIPPNISQGDVQTYFSKFGEIADCILMQDKATGKSRGFGFVTFKDADMIDQVLKEEHKLDGKEIDCKRAVPREQHSEGGHKDEQNPNGRTKKVFVGGLPQTATTENFKAYFEKFGKIEDSVIMVDKETQKSRGFGFVTFDTEDAVEKVIECYSENKIDGKWVECKKAFPRTNSSTPNKRGQMGDKRSSYHRDSSTSSYPSSYGGYGGSYGMKDDPYAMYGGGDGRMPGAYYPPPGYSGYPGPQDYYDERGSYWNTGGAAPYKPEYMGTYPEQDYSYGKTTRGAYPMPSADSSHMGMMGYGYGPTPGMYPGGTYDYVSPTQGRVNPTGDSSVGGAIKAPPGGQARDERFYKPY